VNELGCLLGSWRPTSVSSPARRNRRGPAARQRTRTALASPGRSRSDRTGRRRTRCHVRAGGSAAALLCSHHSYSASPASRVLQRADRNALLRRRQSPAPRRRQGSRAGPGSGLPWGGRLVMRSQPRSREVTGRGCCPPRRYARKRRPEPGSPLGRQAALTAGCRSRAEQRRALGGSESCVPAVWLRGQTGAGVHHRRATRVHGGDDLLGGDPLQVRAGRRQVRVLDMRVIWLLCRGSRWGVRVVGD
jgi:hypothetical protein